MKKNRRLILPCLPLLMLSLPASAEEEESSSYFRDHFTINGYVTLGFADLHIEGERDLTGNEAILGIPEDGAFYGNAALLLRYTPKEKHTFLLQLSARELGDSPVSDEENSIELDWLFYEFQASENTKLRIGRLPAPAGIFNEIRDVGVLLPFYRPSYLLYREGSIYSETVDGIGLSHRFFPESNWSLEADIYYGEFDVLEQSTGFDEGINAVDAREATGFQLWLDTPVEELRFGLGGQRWVVGSESRFNLEPTAWRSAYASFDWTPERFVVRGEYRTLETTSQASLTVAVTDTELDHYYIQLGYHASDKWSFFVQPERSMIDNRNELFVDGGFSFVEREDVGLSVIYRLRPTIVFKAEHHLVESEVPVSNSFIFGPTGVQLRRNFMTFDSNYSILSVSLSF